MSDGMSDGAGPGRPAVDAGHRPEAPPSYHWPFGQPADPVVAPAEPAAGTGRRPGLGLLIGVAAGVALLVGAGAGFGAARLAGPGAADPAVSSGSSGSSGTPEPSPTALPPGETTSTVEVARRVLPSTVMIEVGDGTGSGFVIDGDGHIMTNNHVVAEAAGGTRIRVVFSDGRRTAATLVGRSPSYDLAVIKVAADSRLRPVTFGDSSSTQVGAPVVAIGSPLALPGTVTQGIVSALDRPVLVSESAAADSPTAYIDGIQTDAPINPGNSGGPLVDAGARVIGVNSAILTMDSSGGRSGSIGIGFAIPVDEAKVIGAALVKDGKATYPIIGAQLQEASGGVELTTVDAGGPAAKAGLRVGDLVSTVDGHRVQSRPELVVAVRTHRPGETVTLGYARGAARANATITLGGRVG